MSVKFVNKREFDAALKKMGADVLASLDEAVEDAAIELHGLITRGIQRGPATGKVYKRRSVTHRASAKGEAPMSDTGQLARSIRWDKTFDLKATVSSHLDYAKYLEYGTVNIKPRKIWEPSLLKIEKKFGKMVSDQIKGALR